MRRRGLGEARTRKGIVYADPLRAGRHPFQAYLLALCVISGLPILIGQVGASTIEESVPYWLAFSWGLALFLGAAAGLLGTYWPGDYTNGLTVEQIGLAVVGSAALVYGIIIVITGGVPRFIPAAITVGFGLSCLRRARDIAYIIKIAIQHVNGSS
jgi:hypothetical protein